MGHPRPGVRSGLTLALAVTIGVAASWGLQTFMRPAQRLELSPVFEAALNDPGSPSVGGPGADVTVVIFTDYRCGICQATAPALSRLLAKDQKVRVIYKDWPIRGPDSALSARWALAAVYQGRYRAFHDALMASRGPLDEIRILDIASAAGLDVPRLRSDRKVRASQIEAQIGRHGSQAFGLGLQGTPAYLIGPYLVQGGLDDLPLAAAVRRARRSGRQSG